VIAQSRASAAKNDANILTTQAFDRACTEEACFETIMLSADNMATPRPVERPLPGHNKITILQRSEKTQGKMPDFGYWLFVALVALSVFWISGGHTLFTARH
jgi:hypothetical protein